MSDSAAPRSIFRPEVVRRFTERREQPVLPRYIRPRTFLCLWILLGLLASFAAAGWQVRVPERVAGTAVVGSGAGEQVEVVGFVPAAGASRLAEGQPIVLRLPGADTMLTATVASVDAAPRSPAEAATMAGAADPAALGLTKTGPVVVVRATLPPAADAALWAGSVGTIEITIGSERLTRMLMPGAIAPAAYEEHLP